jgi:hypothetical protein
MLNSQDMNTKRCSAYDNFIYLLITSILVGGNSMHHFSNNISSGWHHTLVKQEKEKIIKEVTKYYPYVDYTKTLC